MNVHVDKPRGSEFVHRLEFLSARWQGVAVPRSDYFNNAVAEQNAQLSGATADANAILEQARQTAQAKFDRRRTRIGKAYQSSKESTLLQVEKGIGGHVGGFSPARLADGQGGDVAGPVAPPPRIARIGFGVDAPPADIGVEGLRPHTQPGHSLLSVQPVRHDHTLIKLINLDCPVRSLHVGSLLRGGR
jgi:hypothetical protein